MSEPTAHSDSARPTLEDVTAYVAAAGWERVDTARGTVWRPTDAEHADLQVALPDTDDVADIDALLAEAIRVVAFVEQRTVLETTTSLVNGGADTLSIRLLPDAPAGSAPLALAQESITALRALVVGAAAGLTNDALVLPSRRPLHVENYAANAHVATRPGSFILDVALPLTVDADDVAGEPEQSTLVDLPAQPYGRQVTERIRRTAANALAMAQRVIDGEATIEQFGEAHRRLGNATELDALARLGGETNDQYQLRLTESALVPTTTPTTLLKATTEQQTRLAEAAEFLRSTQPQEGITIEGYVVRLFRQGNFGAGDVTINAALDDSGKMRKCVMSLPEEDYAEALRAHSEGLVVVATGDLVAVGTRKHLRNPTRFHVVESIPT